MSPCHRLAACLLTALAAGCAAAPAYGPPLEPATPPDDPLVARGALGALIVTGGIDRPEAARPWLVKAAAAGDSPETMAAAAWWGADHDPEAARALLDAALTNAPDGPAVQRFAGELWASRLSVWPREKQVERARRAAGYFRRALADDQTAAPAALGLARTRALDAPDDPEITAALQRAHRLRPQSAAVRVALAHRRLIEGDAAGASALIAPLRARPTTPALDVRRDTLDRQIALIERSPPPADTRCPADGVPLQLPIPALDRVVRVCADARSAPPPATGSAGAGRCVKAELSEVMRKDLRPLLGGCYAAMRSERPNVIGRLKAAFEVGASGRVGPITLVTTRGLEPMVDCVSDAIRAIHFPPPEAGRCQITYKLDFALESPLDRFGLSSGWSAGASGDR